MASRILLRKAVVAACLVGAIVATSGVAVAAPAQSSYYPNWDGNGCRNIVPSQIEWQCQAGAAMTTTTNQQYVYESVTLSVSTIGHYAPWSGSLQIIDVADSSQDCIVSIPAAAGTWECDISGAIGSELDIQLATSSPGVEIVQLAFAPLNQPTATATDTATATGQPTATPTDTVVPGSTSTPIATNTPRPVKTSIATGTPGPTSTAVPVFGRDCGDVYIVVHNCDFLTGQYPVQSTSIWSISVSNPTCASSSDWLYNYAASVSGVYYGAAFITETSCGAVTVQASQATQALASGEVSIDVDHIFLQATSPSCLSVGVEDVSSSTSNSVSLCPASAGRVNVLSVSAGDSLIVSVARTDGPTNTSGLGPFNLSSVDLVPTVPSVTPFPTGTSVLATGTPTETPLPLPFDTGTAIPTGTPCPGGCSVAEATGIPGAIDTVLPIDTSPLSPLAHLSVSRTACQTFGSAPILVPSIHGTPVFGSTQPLSITWSLPVTGTTFTPCADPAFSSTWWDLTWHLSIIVTFIAFLSWLIWYVRRLFQ